jgi:hypothetical protein
MEFLKLVRKRSFLSEFVYTILNIALAVGVFLIVRYTDAVWFAIVLVVLSKWRVFAVRPRYWWANLQSNMVDFIVSISIVMHMYTINVQTGIGDTSKLVLLIGLTLAYIGWLLFIKPRSKRFYVSLQAGTAVFLGMSALFTISYGWAVSAVVIAAWLIGYASARHTLSTFDDETHTLFLSLVWGFVVAEISWVAYHWAIAYPLPIFPTLMLPQAALAVTLVSFLAYKVYDSFYHHAKVRMSDILLPLLFTVSVLLVLLLIFNRVGTAI